MPVYVANDKCIGCRSCVDCCPSDALEMVDGISTWSHPDLCETCGVCEAVCEHDAIRVVDEISKPEGHPGEVRVPGGQHVQRDRQDTHRDFMNSVYHDLIWTLFNLESSLATQYITYEVGRDLLPKFRASKACPESAAGIERLKALAGFLVSEMRVADSIAIAESRSDHSLDGERNVEIVALTVTNCALLDADKRLRQDYSGHMVCTLANMFMGLLEDQGLETERKDLQIEGNQCRYEIGVIGVLPREKEIIEAQQRS